MGILQPSWCLPDWPVCLIVWTGPTEFVRVRYSVRPGCHAMTRFLFFCPWLQRFPLYLREVISFCSPSRVERSSYHLDWILEPCVALTTQWSPATRQCFRVTSGVSQFQQRDISHAIRSGDQSEGIASTRELASPVGTNRHFRVL